MALKKRLTVDTIALGVPAANGEDILKEIARRAVKQPALAGRTEEELLAALKEREEMGSTGLGEGIAIPHCSLDGLNNFVIGIVTTPEGVDFNALDKGPVSLFFYLIGPKNQRNLHISILSSVSKLMLDENNRRLFKEARNPQDILEIVAASAEEETEEEIQSKEKCLIQIFIQDEERFDEVLQILTSQEESSVTVVESQNAGKYLHALPLFSAYWTDNPSKFNRIITGVINKNGCNDTIRRIRMLPTEMGVDNGLLITVQELLYTGGSLDF